MQVCRGGAALTIAKRVLAHYQDEIVRAYVCAFVRA